MPGPEPAKCTAPAPAQYNAFETHMDAMPAAGEYAGPARPPATAGIYWPSCMPQLQSCTPTQRRRLEQVLAAIAAAAVALGAPRCVHGISRTTDPGTNLEGPHQ